MEIKDLKKAKVLVIGDLMLDHYIHGIVERISPEAPVPVILPDNEEFRLGGAANVASNISSLGGKVRLLGILGKDKAGNELKNLLKESLISTKLIRSISPTVTKQRIVVSQQQLLRLDREEYFSKEDALGLKKIIASELKKYSVVILSDYGKGTLQDIKAIITLAKENNCKILVDPKGKDFKKYQGVSIITPNYKEFCEVVGMPKDELDLTKKATNLLKKLKLEALLITRGSDGMTLLISKKRKVIRHDFLAEAKEVFDVSGAGDTVIASFATGISAGNSILEACKLANVAAGIVVGKLGTSVTKPQEITNTISGKYSLKVLEQEEVILKTTQAQHKKEKVVFTNGCFDILHLGHITYLQKAKKLGSKLIVAVNSDSSVRKLKGSKRPVNNLSDRMSVLAALECVDWVVSFSEATPEKLIRKLKPQVLVKGSDYSIKKIVGGKYVESYGGKVKTIPLVEGFSTSLTIAKIRKSDQ